MSTTIPEGQDGMTMIDDPNKPTEKSVCSNDGLCAENSNVVEVTESFYLRATLACIATKKTDDAATLKVIANNALDAIGA